ncbi:hypothetical protein B7494_g1134 [Chlorociboria aeruginascens]|nr:hypothetical protein B7494_g1134 [Chlorociboria aeruginascens]
MSRDPYRSSGDLGFSGRGGGGGGQRWDSERFAMERDRSRFLERDRVEERDSRFTSDPRRVRERSVDEVYERRGPRGFEDDRYERKVYYDDEPRFERERPAGRDRGHSITIEKEREREYYSPSPPRGAPSRPAFLRRQSSLDTFDRRPLARHSEREDYGPPARYENIRPPPLAPLTQLTKPRQLGPPRRYVERDYEDIKIAEPDHYGDDDFRAYPERVREREIIRRRRSKSRGSRRGSVRSSVRSDSVSSSGSSGGESFRNEFPKKGKTRMPARLGETIIIQKALGRENIDEVIKLSEDYKADERIEMSGGRSDAGNIIEERRTEVFTVPAPAPPPPPPAPILMAPPPPPPAPLAPPPPPQTTEVITDTRIVEHRSPSPTRFHHHHNNPIILEARPRDESTFIERREVERSDPIALGPLALAPRARSRSRDARSIRAEIKALEAEKEALQAEKRAEKELRRADRYRKEGRHSEGNLVLYEEDKIRVDGREEMTIVRREKISEPEGGVRIEKDKKGRMSISVPKYVYS